MAQSTAHSTRDEVGYHSIQILKTQTLGIGSYGSVYKAKCDDLICAAKILHPTLFDPTAQQQAGDHHQHRLPFRRFQQECKYLSALKHPNIVQYLGMFQDHDTGLPVLLIELLDDSLTHYLETTCDTLTYHTQVNFCHDIAKALSFLHLNGITHRDLSSNNVLLIANVRAKVTDFGMAKLCRTRAITRSYTMCPGTDVYMPPEAIGERPAYTEKIDCFSFGVIIIQILVRKLPEPSDRLKTIRIDHPQFPVVEVRVSEAERRQNHINEIKPNHSLLPIALECLKDVESERPSAHELCERFVSLKEGDEYIESMHTSITVRAPEECTDGEVQVPPDSQGVNHMKQRLEDAQKQVKQLEKTLKENESIITELKQKLEHFGNQKADHQPVMMKWKQAKNAPFNILKGPNAVSDGAMVYLRPAAVETIFAYNTTSESWTELPECGDKMCSIAIVNHLVTIIGGRNPDGTPSNQLLSLTKNSSDAKWMALFPVMPTSRSGPTTVCKDDVLIVAGGIIENSELCSRIEVMNTNTLVWSRVADAPQCFFWGTIKLCRDRIYLLGGWNTNREQITEVFSCLLSDLLETQQTHSLASQLMKEITRKMQDQTKWKRVADLPVQRSTCVEANGCLLSIGGIGLDDKPVTTVYMYTPPTNNWQVIGNILTAKSWCIASEYSGNKIVTFGGYSGSIGTDTPPSYLIANSSNTVEMATFIH